MKRPLPFHSQAVWPPVLMVAIFVFIYGLLAGGLWLIQLKAGFVPREIMPAIDGGEEFKTIQKIILCGAAGVYALYRLWRFHPAGNWPYAAWLRMSPWTADKPLPLGPVHPVWQDAAVIGVLAGIAKWHAQLDPSLPVLAFGMTYLIIMTILLAMTRLWTAFLALAFLWPALMLPTLAGWPSILLVAALILVICLGHRKSLQTFPWPILSNTNRTNTAAEGRSGLNLELRLDGFGGEPSYLGWPYLALSPKIKRRPIPGSTSFFISALAGWWTYCIVESSRMESLPGLVLTFALAAALLRMLIYCSSIAPPFNIWGRIASGRLILPGFDKIFLTPLAVVSVGIVGGMIIRRSGSWYQAAEACVMALLFFVLLAGGPSLRIWILTGQVRLRPATAHRTSSQMLRRV